MSSPVTPANDPRLMHPDDNAIADQPPLPSAIRKPTFATDPSPPSSNAPIPADNDTLTPHTLTRQANGSLLFEHVSHTQLSPYALDTSIRPNQAVGDRPLSNDQLEGIFNVRSSENEAIPGHQVESTRRYLLRWHSFPVVENWSKALTQPGYPPLKVITDSKPGSWTVEPNAVLFAMAESIYAYRGTPLAGVLEQKTQLIKQGEERYAHIHGRNFPVEEHKTTAPLAIANSQQKAAINTGQLLPRPAPGGGFFIKTPPGLSASDWPPLQIVRNSSSGEWTPVFSTVHLATLLNLLAETGLYGFSQQKHDKVQNFQLGSHYAPIANNISAKIGSLSLPAVIHHGGRLPPVPVKWDPLHRRYYIYSAPQPAVAPSFTEREAWGIRLLMVGHMMRNPIQGTTELIKGMQNDALAQERLAAFIQSGQWPEDSSVSGLSAQLTDMAFNVAFGIASNKGAVGVNVFSWAFTLLGKTLLNQPVNQEDAEEMLAAGADIMELGIDQIAHKAVKKGTVTTADSLQVSPAKSSPHTLEEKSRVDNPLLRWAEAKAVDEPHLQQDSRYANLWRHSATGQLYVQQQHFPRYLPVVKRADNSFVSESYGSKKAERYLTAGKDGQLHSMTAAQRTAWLNKYPTQLELQQRHYREIEVTGRDGSKSIGYVAINPEAIKTVYRFVPESRSFTQSGQSVDAQGRVIGLLGGGPKKRPATDKTEQPPEKRSTRPPTVDDLKAWRDMPQAERDAAGGGAGYATSHGINPGSWAQLAKKDGLTAQGESRLSKTRAPTNDDLQAWRDMSPTQRDAAGGATGYARTQGINPGSWGNLARNDGLTPVGESRLTKTRAPTNDDLKAWRDMPQTERDAVGGTVGYAMQHGINPGTWGSLARNDGLTLKGEAKLTKTRAPTNDDLKAWRDMPQTERDAAGGASGYAIKHGINPGTWSRLVKSDGLTRPGESKLTKTRTPTVDDLKAWRDMSQTERDAVGGTVGYATRHGINQGSWAQLANNAGLAAQGESRLIDTRAPTNDDLKTWQDMRQEERDAAGGAIGYATKHGINPGSWGSLARSDGLTPQGKSRLSKTRAPTNDDLKTWRDMSQAARDDSGGAVGYASKHGINPGSWVTLARNQGLTLKGESKLTQTRAPTVDDLKTWRDMSQTERDAVGGTVGYATTHGINQGSWASWVNKNGLSTRGQSKLAKTRAPTNDDLRAWRDMSQAERDAAGGTVGYAVKNGINMNTWASRVNKNGLSIRGEQKLNSAQAEKTAIKAEVASQPHASGPVKMILLTDDGGEMEIHNPSPSRLDEIPATDNSLPILRDPNAFSHSLTLRAEGIKDASELNLFGWNGLFSGMSKMSKKQIDSVKARLTAEIRRQVSNETQLGEEISRRMVSRPSHREDDQGNIINLGSGIFNPESGATVPRFTVLGPYAGVFYDSQAAINRAVRRLGTERSLSHSWQTRSSQRIVDGWESGNELRNINTHRLGDAPAVAEEPNVAIVRVGKNLSFYVTSKDVKPGEEYFVDYGPGYNRHFAVDHARKEEQMAQFWLDHRLEAESLGISLEHLTWRNYLDPKEVGRAILQFRQKNSGGQALDEAARRWLENHPLPVNQAKTQEVAGLYLRHQAEAESWGITPARMAEHYGVQEQALRKKIAHPLRTTKQNKLSADADKWLENNPLQDNSVKVKQEPADFAEGSPLAWLADNINESSAWVDRSFEAMPQLIARSNTLRQTKAFLVITNQNKGISQIIDSRTGNIIEPQDALYTGRPLVVIQRQGNHYDAWTNPGQNVTFLEPDSAHSYYRVNTTDQGNQWQPIAESGYCMTEATAAALISRDRTQPLTEGDIQEYAHSLRNDIRERIRTLNEAERQQLEAIIPGE